MNIQKGFSLILVLVGILVTVVIAGGAYYFVKVSNKSLQYPLGVVEPDARKLNEQSKETIEEKIDETTNWKIYKNESITFKFPSSLIEKPAVSQKDGFTQEFKNPENKFTLTFLNAKNFNQATNKPFATIDEYVGLPYRVTVVTIDGQEGRQPLPRAGSENVNSVIFFSKDSRDVYTLELKAGNTPFDTSETEIEEGQKLFKQILSTFRFD